VILTLNQLASCTGARIDRAQAFLPYLVTTMREYAIDTSQRAAAFLAQVGHESGGLKFTTELWGPTPEQARYERDFDEEWPPPAKGHRNWKAYELGNAQPGDGFRFRGHGLLQNTGRANHAGARDRLRVKFGPRVPDFEAEPHRLAEVEWAALSAGDFWASRNLNDLADAGEFQRLTRRINGATNGYEHRLALWENGKAVLA
jgi:putative chitinase